MIYDLRYLAAFLIVATLLPGSAGAQPATPLQGIWSVSIGDGSITLGLHQDEGQIFGPAKSEGGEPWNAAAVGSVSGNQIELTLTYLQDGAVAVTRLQGTSVNGSISGRYVHADALGGTASGSFIGSMINPDLSAYEPVATASAAPAIVAQASDTGKPEVAQLGSTKYTDVHSMAGTVPETLGVIPPAMGIMGGLGGMGGSGGAGMS